MECLIVVVVFICMIAEALRYLSHGPSVRKDTHIFDGDKVDNVITYGGHYIDGVDLEDIDNLDDIELVDSRRFGLMYADEYPPYNELRRERWLGLDDSIAEYPWGDSNVEYPWDDLSDDPDDWDEDDEWDREDDNEW